VDETGKLSPGVTFNTPMCNLVFFSARSLTRSMASSQSAKKPPFMRDQLMASASDFNSKPGFMLRAEEIAHAIGNRMCIGCRMHACPNSGSEGANSAATKHQSS